MSASRPKEVLVVGVGAVGAMYSYILKKSGLARVTIVARSNFDALNDHGLHIKSQKYGQISGWKPDRLYRSLADAANQQYDYVVVTTKAVPDLITTPTLLAPLLSPPYSDQYAQPAYVLLQNGMNVEIDLDNALKNLGQGEPKIVSAAVYILANLLEPNVVEHNTFDRLTIGVYRPNNFTAITNTPAEAALLEDIGAIFQAGGTEITIVPEVQQMKFAKNYWNVTFSAFSTLTGHSTSAIFRPPPSDSSAPYSPYVSPQTAELVKTYTIPVIRAILEEQAELGRAMGFPDSETTSVDWVLNMATQIGASASSTHKYSMHVDAENGRPIEVEVIFGEVVRMAKQRNIDIPRTEMLYAILLVVQNQILRKMEETKAN